MTRDEKGRFPKGVSGNPGGRPSLSVSALIDAAVTKEDWNTIINKLLVMAKHGNLKAIEILFDRRFGKPIQENHLAGTDGGPIKFIEVVRDVSQEGG